jgi:hypothetical protein
MRNYIEKIIYRVFDRENMLFCMDRVKELEKKVFALESPPLLREGRKYKASIVNGTENPKTFTCVSSEVCDANLGWKYTVVYECGKKEFGLRNYKLRNIKEIKCEAK